MTTLKTERRIQQRAGRKAREIKAIMAQRFRRDRLACWLSPAEAAKVLHVTERTLHNWESGATRVPYAAYKLMRVLRGCELPLLAGPRELCWHGFYFQGGKLITPEGRAFVGSDFAWLSLLVERARLGWKRCLPAVAGTASRVAMSVSVASATVPMSSVHRVATDSSLLSGSYQEKGLFPGGAGVKGAVVGPSSNTGQKGQAGAQPGQKASPLGGEA